MEAKLIGKIDISAACGGKGYLGDLDSDGRMEVVFAEGDGDIDDRYTPHKIEHIVAYRLTGEIMWERGETPEKIGGFGSDFPIQLYDIDNDGHLEVLCVMKDKFLVLNGMTGEVKREFSLPHPDAHDCILIANLRGLKHAEDIILKDRYFNMWALDSYFNLLWTHKGNLGHFPLVYDYNHDGYDEVMAGYDMLSHDGQVMWSCKDLSDHADCLWVGDVRGNKETEIVVGGSVTCLYDVKGNEIWRYLDTIESQHVALGHFIKGEKGLQIAGLDRIRRGDGYKGEWDGHDGMFLIDNLGHTIWKEDRKTKGWLTIVDSYSNWNGEGNDYILAYRRGGGVMPGLYNTEGEQVITFPHDGYVLHADLFGRGIEDAIVYDRDTAYIFSGTEYDLKSVPSGKALRQTRRLYSQTLYPGEVYGE